MKVLIVKLSSIGDVIHALPAVPAIKAAMPDAEISWVVESRSAGILRGNELISNLIEVDTRSLRKGLSVEEMLREIGRQVKEIRKFKFDIAIDLQGLLKSAVIAKLSGAPKRIGFSRKDLREPASRLFYTGSVKMLSKMHIIRRNLAVVAGALNIPVPDSNFDFPVFTSQDDVNEAEGIASRAGADFAILNPAGGWVTKLWHAEKFGELADMLWEECGLASVVATGPGEGELAQKVLQNSRSGKVILTEPTLKGFYELARRAQVYVGGDTGPTHLAVAAGAPVVGIFGPTEWWRNGSTNPLDICVGRDDIACRIDCHRRTCSNWICMDISVDTVFSAVKARLDG